MKMNNGLSVWRDNWSPLSEFRREFDRLFDDLATPVTTPGLRTDQSFVPACDVEELSDHYLLSLEMAGIKKEDIKLEVNGGQLTVSGERHTESKQKQEGQWYSERRYGKFERSFALPAGIDADKVEANYQDGILRIIVPKSESAKPRQIKIGNGGSIFFGKFLTQPKEAKEEVHSSNEISQKFSGEIRGLHYSAYSGRSNYGHSKTNSGAKKLLSP
jgi:HSP20 family protein